jgi:Family of unknown function (DUF695)
MPMGTRLLLGVALLLLLAGCRQNKERGPFVVLQGEKDGHPLFAVIDKTERDDQFKATFPWYLEISTQFMDSTPDGFPKDQEAAVLAGWEDSLEKEIGGECRFVYIGHLTWNKARTVLYYVDRPERAVAKLKKIANDHAQRAFTVKSQRDEHWDKVSEYVKSARGD